MIQGKSVTNMARRSSLEHGNRLRKETTMNATDTIKYEQLIPEVLQAMAAVHGPLDARGLDRKLVHLVRLRASQMNHCGFCVKCTPRRPGTTVRPANGSTG